MKHYFSPSTGGFYSDRIHGAPELPEPQNEREQKAGKRPRMVPNPATKIPSDAVELDDGRHAQLMEAQATGKVIEIRGGKPVAVEPRPDAEEARAARRRERDRRLAASDWTQVGDSPLPAVLKGEWARYRKALRDLDMDGADWPLAPGEEIAAS